MTNFWEEFFCSSCLQARFVDQPFVSESQLYKLRLRSLLRSTPLGDASDEHSTEMMKLLFRLIEIMDCNRDIRTNLRGLRAELDAFVSEHTLNEARRELILMTVKLVDFCLHVASVFSSYKSIVEQQAALKSHMKLKYDEFNYVNHDYIYFYFVYRLMSLMVLKRGFRQFDYQPLKTDAGDQSDFTSDQTKPPGAKKKQ